MILWGAGCFPKIRGKAKGDMKSCKKMYVRLEGFLDYRVDEALQTLMKRRSYIEWDKERLLQLAIFHGLKYVVRQHERKKVRLQGSCWKVHNSLPAKPMVVRDLSYSGICFEIEDSEDIEENDIFEVRFDLNGEKPMNIHKQVVVKHVEDPFVGARFCNSFYESTRALTAYLDQL
jgi:hypothetical protein